MSSFSQVLKKHRHRIGLAYFAAGALFGIVVCNVFSSNKQPVASTSSLKGGLEGKSGWKNIHVFYGDSKHIKDNSAVPNDYYDRVRWFSQARQDEVIAALLRNKTNGYFVDLASNDPVRISNTYALEKFYGWKGLCLEPNPVYWAGLSYRQCDVVGAVVGGERMQEIWFKFPNRAGPQGGIVGKGFDNKLSSKFDEDRPRYTVTLLEIFQQFKTPSVIDYLSLDVEGAEDLVMNSFPFQKYRFNIISLERPSENMKALLDKHGYIFYRLIRKNVGETIFIHKSVKSKVDTAAAEKIDTEARYSETLVKR